MMEVRNDIKLLADFSYKLKDEIDQRNENVE